MAYNDKKDQIILQQLDVIRRMTENNLRRSTTDFWGAPRPTEETPKPAEEKKPPAAARPETAVPLYDAYCQALREKGLKVETGVFQADMDVELVNWGPVTLLLDSRKAF